MQAGSTMGLLTPLIADITVEGLSLVGEVTAEELALTDADAVIRAPLSVSLDLNNADDMIAVTGVIEGTVVRQCVRCLRNYDDPLAFSIHAAFAREGKETKSPGRQMKPADPRKGRSSPPKQDLEAEEETDGDDRYFYRGDHLELGPMLREHIILAAPMQPLCREDCAGLCAQCGKDLNEGLCQCPAEPPATGIRVIRSKKH